MKKLADKSSPSKKTRTDRVNSQRTVEIKIHDVSSSSSDSDNKDDGPRSTSNTLTKHHMEKGPDVVKNSSSENSSDSDSSEESKSGDSAVIPGSDNSNSSVGSCAIPVIKTPTALSPDISLSGLNFSPLRTPAVLKEKEENSKKRKQATSDKVQVKGLKGDQHVNFPHLGIPSVSYACPENYEVSEFGEQDFWKETLPNSELWLVKVPSELQVSKLDGVKINVGSSEVIEVPGKVKKEKRTFWQVDAVKNSNKDGSSVCTLLPSKINKVPRFAGKFAGEIHISKAIPTKATVTEPPVKEKHILPEGLKMRNMPFGADGPIPSIDEYGRMPEALLRNPHEDASILLLGKKSDNSQKTRSQPEKKKKKKQKDERKRTDIQLVTLEDSFSKNKKKENQKITNEIEKNIEESESEKDSRQNVTSDTKKKKKKHKRKREIKDKKEQNAENEEIEGINTSFTVSRSFEKITKKEKDERRKTESNIGDNKSQSLSVLSKTFSGEMNISEDKMDGNHEEKSESSLVNEKKKKRKKRSKHEDKIKSHNLTLNSPPPNMTERSTPNSDKKRKKKKNKSKDIEKKNFKEMEKEEENCESKNTSSHSGNTAGSGSEKQKKSSAQKRKIVENKIDQSFDSQDYLNYQPAKKKSKKKLRKN